MTDKVETFWENTDIANNNIYRDFLSILNWPGVVTDTASGLRLTAKTLTPLQALVPMDYAQVDKMILHLCLQVQVLQKYNKGLFGFTLADVRVIDTDVYFLANLANVIDIRTGTGTGTGAGTDNNNILLNFTYPLKFTAEKQQFFAPELKAKLAEKVLPFTITSSVGYYSLAKLCLYCLQLEDNMEVLAGSKMYYFLKRCLNVNPAERFLLYF